METSEKAILLSIIFIVFILFVFLAWYFSHKAKHKERLMLIEKGMNTDKLKLEGSKFPWLKLGIVVLGFSIGLLILAILAKNGLLSGPGTYPLSILGICGGLSLVIANYVDRKNVQNK